MIQRKQTLFILLSVMMSVALLFIKTASVIKNGFNTHVFLVPLTTPELVSTIWHYIAIALNFINLLLCFAVIFMYNKRKQQINLSYLVILFWIVLGVMMLCAPFVEKDPEIAAMVINYYTLIIAGIAIVATYLAIRLIKKDIELLKSADRIR